VTREREEDHISKPFPHRGDIWFSHGSESIHSLSAPPVCPSPLPATGFAVLHQPVRPSPGGAPRWGMGQPEEHGHGTSHEL
jgi:hypothetical protein